MKKTVSNTQNQPERGAAIYILSTHWDREWYQTFQDFRCRLVSVLDEILEGFCNKEILGPLTLDGQAVPLEDYLEIRPENRDLIVRLAREGLLGIGPWYVQPDEWLVSGESLIRNLEFGRRVARAMGTEPSRAGFVCDQFGHIGQLPQIFSGFGIRGVFLWRGLNPRKFGVLRWRGADGTTLPAYRFHGVGYSHYAHSVRQATDLESRPGADDFRIALTEFLERESQRLGPAPVLIFDGGDHLPWDKTSYAVIREVIEDPPEGRHVVHGSLDDYCDILTALPQDELEEVCGELREPGVTPLDDDQAWLIPGILSSRVPLKQQNFECETLLCHFAEPLAALAKITLGRENPRGFLDVAWKWLLQNHAHDSICGCSIDAVHRDMEFRFAQARQIAWRAGCEALKALMTQSAPELAPRERLAGIYNPLPVPVDSVEILDLEIPCDWPCGTEFFGYEDAPAFEIFDADGAPVPYQRLGMIPNQTRRVAVPGKFPQEEKIHVVTVAVRVNIPSLGFALLRLVGRPDPPPVPIWGLRAKPSRSIPGKKIAQSPRCLDNGKIRVVVEPDGSLTLTDLAAEEEYRRALVFEDCADIGDGWHYGGCVNDEVFSSPGTLAECAVVASGPLAGSLRLRHRLELPERFDFAARRRSSGRERLDIVSTLRLREGEDCLEVLCEIENRVRDHRLRVTFATGVNTGSFITDSAFDVVERPVGCNAWPQDSREPEVDGKPQRSWTSLASGRRAFAVVAPGLHEVAVADDPARTLAVTLFRATGRTVFTSGEPDGQLLGPLRFRLALALGARARNFTALTHLATRLQLGAPLAQIAARDLAARTADPPQRRASGLFEIEGNLIPSAVRVAGDELEIRLYNPAATPESARLIFNAALLDRLGEWHNVTLDGRPLQNSPPQPCGSEIPLTVGAKKIITLRVALPNACEKQDRIWSGIEQPARV